MRWMSVWLGLLTWACGPLAWGQAPATNLTLDAMVAEAVRVNPAVQSSRYRRAALQERVAQQQALPNPMFKYGGMDLADRGNWPDTNEKRFMVEQEFPWFGKRGLRGRAAAKEAEALQREVEALERDVIMMVKENYFDLYAVQRARVITRAEEDVLQHMEQIAETRFATGQRTEQDVLKAQAEITMLQQKRLELEQQETTLKAKLNQLLNRRADAPLGLAAAPPVAAAEAEAGTLFALAETNRPEIKGAQAQLERQQAERELMKKEFFTDYRLGVEYRNFGESPDMVMFTVGIDLPIWQRKYRAGVREADNLVAASRAALEATRRQTAFEVQDARFKLLTARRTLDLYQRTLIPQAEARFTASEAGYRTGKVDFLDLLESERFLLNARVMAAMAAGNLGMQGARLERAVGTDLKPALETGEKSP